MTKILILGASGSLAKYVIEEAQQQASLKLTLFLRNERRLSVRKLDNLRVVEGDVMDYETLKNAVKGQDIVYINLEGDLESMAYNIMRAMKAQRVKRVVAISSIGIYDVPMKPILNSYRKLADIIEGSGIDYTILRPDWFTNADEIDYILTKKGESEIGTAISRKSIAAFVVSLFMNPTKYINENMGISKLE